MTRKERIRLLLRDAHRIPDMSAEQVEAVVAAFDGAWPGEIALAAMEYVHEQVAEAKRRAEVQLAIAQRDEAGGTLQ